MKFFRKRSVWVLMTTYIFSWFVISLVAGNVLDGFKKNINTALGLTGTRTQVIEDDEDADTEYFKTSFIKKDSSGNPIYVTDDNGFYHQQYDDVALREATVAKAEEVQRQGSTLLWNHETNGLPIEKGSKVSVFSHSSVDWAESGPGSGVSQVNPNSTVFNELTNAGLEVNKTLWDFYNTGEGSSYVRQGNVKMNEVPWSVYTNAVKSSFETYGDAAIVVITRITREASTGGNGGDATKTLADTPTGDYFDFSNEEEEIFQNLITLKNAGTFKKIIVLLNTPTGMFMDNLIDHKDDIDCCLWVGFTGYQGLHEVANILVGDSIPSGHLPDTFPYNTQSAPSSVNVEAKIYTNAAEKGLSTSMKAYLTYAENIYVGYKYYETRYEDCVLNQGNANSSAGVQHSTSTWKYSEEVAFPFGYGASYTNFEFSNYNVTKLENGDYEASVKVKNIGTKQGYEVAQIYVQKPYTEYDKENNIEQASVNLAGFAKTKLLSPNEEETLTMTIRDDAFKTYDANNKETYIREKTNGINAYYLTVAKDSHDAINNILAAKGKTIVNTGGAMDKDGNADFVRKYEFSSDDFETYSVSEKTGYKIQNQFNDVDWNKYQNKSDPNVTYLSRKDWQGTYPISTVALSVTDAMVIDLANTHEVPQHEGDEMPIYNQPALYNLIDLRGLEYDDPMWDVLLNQLSIDEQIELIAHAYFGTSAISSIGKPSDVAADGPMGLKRGFKYTPSIKTMSYPSPTVLAASFNAKLAREVGELTGEDALHSGTTGLYSPGSNTHRSMYGARNWEYHSEDGFLSGIIGKERVIGSQSKGCYVNMKHFALNDQESYRHGVNVWCNEQALREIYLASYEYAAVEGNCSGFMSSFTRFGTRWSGGHRGLCTEVVRNEWGVKGFILSDSAWQTYMGVVDGVLAGNDCILSGSTDVNMYSVAKTNPTVAIAVRESAHRMLYVVGNSNAMNGLSSNVRIFEVNEWWQFLVMNIQIGIGAVALGFLLTTVLIFVFYKPIIKENKNNKDSENNNKKPFFKKHKFKVILAGSVAVVVSAISITTPFLMKDLYPNYLDNQTKTSYREKIEGNPSLIKFEAENAFIDTDISSIRLDYEGKAKEEVNNPSGVGYVSGVGGEGSLYMNFNYLSDKSTKAVVGLSFGAVDEIVSVSSMYDIYVNNSIIPYRKLSYKVPAAISEELVNYDWHEADLAIVDIVEGLNVITLVKKDDGNKYLNIDYAYLYVDATIHYEDEKQTLYSFDCNNDLDPYLEKYGGSIVDPDYTYKKEGDAGLYRYGNLNEAVLTSTLVVEKDTVATISVIGDCRPNKKFSSIPSDSSNPHIAHLSINGENQYHKSLKVYPSIGWNNYRNLEIATIFLKAGENIVSMTIGGDNMNSCGISLYSPNEIKLKNQGDVPPIVGNKQKLEVEEAKIDSNIASLGLGYEGKTKEQTNNPSGTGFIYNANKDGYLTITFKFFSDKSTTATFGMCFGRREYSLSVSSMYNIGLNNSKLEFDDITISVMKEGGVKYYDWFDQDIVDININEGLNVITLTKVDNAPKILNLDYIYLNTDATITRDPSLDYETYVFDVNDATDPSNEQNELNPFIPLNGGNRVDSDGAYATEMYGLYRYGAGNNAVLTVTLVVGSDTTVTFKLLNDCRPGRSFSFTQSQSSYPYIEYLKVNDSSDGVVPSTLVYESKGWNVFMQCELAKIDLKAGKNTIEFKIAGDNINYCGIAIDSMVEVGLGELVNKYVFNTNDAEDPSIEENSCNPFAVMNGGSVVDANKNYIAETAGLYRYGNGNEAVVTFTLIAGEDETVLFKLINDCRPGKSFSSNATETGYPYISSLTVNDSSEGITRSSNSYASKGWNVMMECEVATIPLKAGTNVIVFNIAGDNINYCGVVIEAFTSITLGHN